MAGEELDGAGEDEGGQELVALRQQYGIGAFLSAPYLVPAQMAAEDAEKTGKSNPAMYFAIQGLFTAVVGAVSTGLIWPNLRNVSIGGNDLAGTHMMTYFVIVFAILAIVAAGKLPEEYNQLGRAKK